MSYLNILHKKNSKTLFFVSFLFLPLSIFAQKNARLFPYTLPLTGTTKPEDIKEAPTSPNAPQGANRYTTNGLVLTTEDNSIFSGFALDGVDFKSNYGLEINFSYAMYKDNPGVPADGLSFFLYEANADFNIGHQGASLGYADSFDQNGNQSPGLLKGFLGIGFDVYGGFKHEFGTVNGGR